MGLRENLDWGEKAVAHVKTYVSYASSNQRLDRLASQIQADEAYKHTTGVQIEAQRAAQKAAATAALAASSVAAKKTFFENAAAATAPFVPPKLPIVPKPSVMNVATPVDNALTAIRGIRDPVTKAVIVPSATNNAFNQAKLIGKPHDYHTWLMAMAWAAMNMHAGNCGELAALAFIYLEGEGVHPLDYMHFTAPDYDHVWVVIGRAAGSDPLKLSTWGAEAVFCDPWQLREGRVYSVEDLIKKKAVNLDAKYKLDSVEAVEGGLPLSEWRID